MSDRHEIATVEIDNDVYVAVQDGQATGIYDPDGHNLITFFALAGEGIDKQTLQLIVLAYHRGVRHGIESGKTMARLEIHRALGL